MLVEKKNNEEITVTFSGKVGTKGLNRIKSFIEFLEKSTSGNKVSSSVINS